MARKQYGKRRADDYDRVGTLAPIPRRHFAELVRNDERGDGEAGLAEAVTKLWTLRRQQLSARNIMDLRMLRYLDPERMEDHWQNWLTGAPLAKLKTRGLSVEMYQWPAAVVQALVGLLAGHKPMAYQFDVMPEDPASDASVFQADIHEKWLYREQAAQDYPIIYQDLITYFVSIGRCARLISVHPKTKRIRTLPVWPGHLATFWQEDSRTIEQVVVARNMSVGEAAGMWPDRARQIENAVFKGYARDQRRNVDILSSADQVTVLECWYRLGDDGETIAKADILIGDNSGDTPNGTVLLEVDETRMPDIPVRITPRLKVPDRTPDESTGALQAIAGPVTEYAEILSSYKDMTNALVYPRFVASGFTYRNAPRLDRTIGGVIPLPRSDQRLQRLEETMNTTPPEQLLAHEEELIVLFAGLSPHFLGRAPSAETSGEAISASIHASIMVLEPQRSNIQRDEMWTYQMWSALASIYGEWAFEGHTVAARDVLIPWPTLSIEWRDIRPREEVRAKQMALAAVQQGVISKRTARNEWSILSPADELRQIIRERKNVVTNPEHASQTAAAIIQQVTARQAQMQEKVMAAQQGMPPAASMGGDPSDPAAVAEEAVATAQAQGQPPSFTNDNEPGGGVGTSEASLTAPPGRGGF